MRYLLFISILFLNTSCSNEQFFKNSICITNVNIIDTEGGLQNEMTIVIKNDRILKVVPSKDFLLSSSNTIIDGKGKYLIPGLWDAHVHFAYIEELAPKMFDLFLGFGVTSVRDTGGEIGFVKKWKEKSLANPTSAPRVMIAGPLLDGIPNVYDGSTPARPPLSVGAGTVEEAIKIVEELDEQNVDLIKAYEMLTPDQFKAVAKLAKEKGLKVTGHVPLSMDVISASNAGMNSMEHLRNLEFSCASNSDELLQNRRKMLKLGAKDAGGVLRSRIHSAQRIEAVANHNEEMTQRVLAALAENQTWQIPTLSIMTGFVKRHFTRPEWKESFQLLPDSVGNRWLKGVEAIEKTEIDENQSRYVEWSLEMVGKINASKIGIMAGTDCPIFYLTPGLSLHEELALLVEGGLSPMEALTSATLRPAEYFDLQNELGLIKEGFYADLVLLEKNPLENIRNTTTINSVIKSGKLYSKEELEKIKKQ